MDALKRIPGRRFLHSPGPTAVPDEVVHAMSLQPMDLADPRVSLAIKACEAGLKRLLQTRDAEVFMYACNGHGVWEATLVNLIAPGRSVLIAGGGHFSDSWAEQATGLGCKVVRTPARRGYPVDPAGLEQVLRDDKAHEIAAVCMVHTDTATSITSDLKALRAAVDGAGHPALFVADVVASLAAEPFAMDELRVDVAIGASQKGLMVPPGLAFVAVNAKAAEVAQNNPAPRYYWDWARRRNAMSYAKFCGTPPLSLVFGLEAALGLLFREGMVEVIARHRLLAGAVHAAVAGWSESGAIGFHAQEAASRSVSVTTITLPQGTDPEAMRTVARERFQVAIAGGLGPLRGSCFRIGHLGDLNPAMILGCLAGVEAAMAAQGVPFGRDGLARAVAHLAGT